MINVKFLKDKIVKYKNKLKSVFNFVMNINIDWVFVLMASYFIIQILPFHHRILGSIGFTYIYHMIINSIKEVKNSKR